MKHKSKPRSVKKTLQLERLEPRFLLATILVSETGGQTQVDEFGASDSISVSLSEAPASTVKLNVGSIDDSEAVVSPAQLTFDGSNWSDGQIVTITGVDDSHVDGTQLTQVVVSVDVDNSDPAFASVDDVLVNVTVEDDLEVQSIEGTFLSYIEQLKNIARDSRRYVFPTVPSEPADGSSQIEQFHELAIAFRAGDLEQTAIQADALNFDLVQFDDTPDIYGVVERPDGDMKTRGWGSYFWNFAGTSDALIEVTHPLHDSWSWQMSAISFTRSNSTGFMMAGTHRDTGPNGSTVEDAADVAHLEYSVFQAFHEAWTTSTTEVWQLHGFDMDFRPDDWPQTADTILSTGEDIGAGYISPQLVSLDHRMEAAQWETYVYAQGHRREACTNSGEPGTKFSDLAATTNVQGDHTRSIGAEFMHVELEQSIRLNGFTRRRDTANLLGDEIASTHDMVEVLLPDYQIPENATELIGTVSRIGDTSEQVEVLLSSDNAVASVPNSVTLSPGQSAAEFVISIQPDDAIIENDEIAIIEIQHSTLPTCSATLVVADDDTPVLSIVSVELNEGLSNPDDLASGEQPTSWQQQRSHWDNVVITFDQDVVAQQSHFVLTNLGLNANNESDNQQIDLAGKVQVNGSQVTIDLQNDLLDGVYRLEILPSATSIDGFVLDGNGVGGDPFVLVGDSENEFYRLEAEWSGDHGVSVFDFSAFSYWFGIEVPLAPAYVDLNDDGGVSVFDFEGFSQNFGVGVVFPVALLERVGISEQLGELAGQEELDVIEDGWELIRTRIVDQPNHRQLAKHFWESTYTDLPVEWLRGMEL